MAVYTMHVRSRKGGEVVGAIDVNPNVIGKDIGTIMGKTEMGVKVTALENAEETIRTLKPDIAIVTTMSLLNDVKDALMLCAKLGVNAITTCEEAFFPWNSNPQVTKEIDDLANQNWMHNCRKRISRYILGPINYFYSGFYTKNN